MNTPGSQPMTATASFAAGEWSRKLRSVGYDGACEILERIGKILAAVDDGEYSIICALEDIKYLATTLEPLE